MTYSELVAAIQSYTENQFPTTYLADGSGVDATTQINTFITQAEQRIFNTVQFPSLRRNVTGTTSTNNKYLACPSDFLSAYSMAVVDQTGNYEYLLNKDVNFIRQAYPNPTTDVGLPKYYAIFGPTTTSGLSPTVTDELSFILGPTPDDAYSVELHYFYYPTSIVQGALKSGTITAGSGITLYFAGTSLTGSRTLAQRGLASILCVDTNTFVITGSGLS